jgi:hypothetical protein
MSNSFRNSSLSRRSFLRGTGVALALPFLDAMVPAVVRGQAAKPSAPRRMVAIETNQGIMPQMFFPERAGRDYEMTPYLNILRAHRNDMTIFSGVSHPSVDGGHQAEKVFLTAAPHPGSGAFRNSVSLDQVAAERIGVQTRFPSFSLRVGAGAKDLSFTRSGVNIPSERSPAAIYRRMFVQGTARETAARVDELRVGRSVLDFVRDGARRLERNVGPRDRERLDQYFSSVRELETQMQRTGEWEQRPRPAAPSPAPTDVTDRNRLIDATRLMYDMVRLALETDSTRLITIFISTGDCVPAIDGVSHETHSLTHHGNREDTVEELRKIEAAQFGALNDLLTGLRGIREQGSTLLDRTMVLYGTCMGSANRHSNDNLPVLLAGGGFRHGEHLVFDRQRNYPLPNLFVSMLQRLGLEIDRFASSTGTMRGLTAV